MPASNSFSSANRSIAPGLGEDELQTEGLLEEATLDANPLIARPERAAVGLSQDSIVDDELPELEPTPVNLDEPDSVFRPSALPGVSAASALSSGPSTGSLESGGDIDPLTGAAGNDPVLGDSPPRPISSQSLAPEPDYAIVAEGRVVINNGGDLDGDPLDASDDARLYAGDGIVFNNTPVLPVQRDESGNPILDDAGNPLVDETAVSVSADYSVATAFNNPYSNLLPPQEVATETVDVPSFADTIANELSERVPAGTTEIDFNPNQVPLYSQQVWEENFPAPGTAENPTVVRIANGSLGIPNGVDIVNTVIILETG
ncbi:MAG: hypothetical protein AAF974_06040, partial [Cyanobacteria bacterium P01_E01_bin.34]